MAPQNCISRKALAIVMLKQVIKGCSINVHLCAASQAGRSSFVGGKAIAAWVDA